VENLAISIVPDGSRLQHLKSQRTALTLACVAGFAFSANYTNHAPLVVELAREFGFNRTLAGLLTTGIFTTHAMLQVPGGHLVDRLGSRLLLICALAWVTFGNFAIALSSAYWQLLFWKMFTGIGTGTCFVAGARYVHEALRGPRLHIAQGLYGGSILLGSGFVVLVLPRVQVWRGWRAAFVVTAVTGCIALALWTAEAPHVPAGVAAAASLRGLVLSSQLWLLGLMQMASFGLAVIVGSWIISLLGTALGMVATQAGMVGSLVLLLGIVTRPLGGVLRRYMGMRPLLASAFTMNAAGCLALAYSSQSFLLPMAAVMLLGAGCGLPYAALVTRAGRLFPDRAGAAIGMVNMLGILMILLGAPVVGRLADGSGSFRSSFLALAGFSVLVCTAVPFLDPNEPSASV
jgi:MFS family permease